jgi:hypothetical protein
MSQLSNHKLSVHKLQSIHECKFPLHTIPDIKNELDLHQVKLLALNLGDCIEKSQSDWVIEKCTEVFMHPGASIENKALSSYLLGIVYIFLSRQSGALQHLWKQPDNAANDGNACYFCSDMIENARRSFQSCLQFTGLGNDEMTRNALRCLALATGPGYMDGMQVEESCALINASLHREHELSDIGSNGDNEDVSTYSWNVADRYKKRVMERLHRFMQDKWRFISMVIVPTGELLVSVLQRSSSGTGFTSTTTCIFPSLDNASDKFSTHVYDIIVRRLDAIVKRSQDQLKGMQSPNTEKQNDNVDNRKEWWKQRTDIDERLSHLLTETDTMFFSKIFHHPDLCEADDSDSEDGLTCRNLANRFDEACQVGSNATTAPDVTGRSNDANSMRENFASDEESEENMCTFLLLDEHLARFPFESLPSLSNSTVCRLSSLSLAINILEKVTIDSTNGPQVDPTKVRYVLDPESNLSGTVERMEPFLKSSCESFGSDWDCIVNNAPSADFIREAVTDPDGMYLFFGHGGGTPYFSRRQLANLEQEFQSKTGGGVVSTVVLMGCSSGRLESINQKGTDTIEPTPIHYDLEGIALSYLQAGAPCVIGNLWDVTDRDIDRFAVAMLQSFWMGHDSLATCVAQARSACRLRYMVGAAPVCYGFPVHLLLRPTHRSLPS